MFSTPPEQHDAVPPDIFPPRAAAGYPVPALTAQQVNDALRHQARLQEITDLDLLNPDVQALLQSVSTRAAKELGLPISVVSIVLDEAQHFASSYGLGGWLEEAGGTPVEWSFCRFTVASQEAFVVEDATRHRLVRNNPLVEVDGVRCYAGIPLISSRGFALGSLCVLGTDAHSFREEDLTRLRALATEAVALIESRRPSTKGAR